MDPQTAQQLNIEHSCYPNSAFNAENELVNIRALRPDERVTVDYSTLFVGEDFRFRCHCGYNGCRTNIRGFETLPVIIQDNYLTMNMVPHDILTKFKGMKFRVL
jgi:hypothetical protein